MAPVFLDERADAYEGVEEASASNEIGAPRVSNKGFLPITCQQYLSLLDGIGRMIRSDKYGRIPAELPPIMERLNFGAEKLLGSILDLFDGPSAFRAAPLRAG